LIGTHETGHIREMKDLPDPRGARPAARIQAPPTAFGIDGLVALGVGVTAVACLYFASAVLIPITLAILLSFLVAPLVDSLARLKLGHVASVLPCSFRCRSSRCSAR
jgi:hypothetical protein